VAEGVEGIVQFKGPVNKIIYQLVGGLKSSMGYMGSKTIKDFIYRSFKLDNAFNTFSHIF
jgi:IMP dehydrogenase